MVKVIENTNKKKTKCLFRRFLFHLSRLELKREFISVNFYWNTLSFNKQINHTPSQRQTSECFAGLWLIVSNIHFNRNNLFLNIKRSNSTKSIDLVKNNVQTNTIRWQCGRWLLSLFFFYLFCRSLFHIIIHTALPLYHFMCTI